MVVKFFSSRNGGGVSSINYLLNERKQQGTARILQGDEQTTRNIILSLKQKHKACVGCLSFEEKEISESAKQEIMQSFENTFLTSAMQGRYNILWVEHTDKGRLELNFVIPKIDLESQRAFNPYFHKADFKLKDTWTDLTNLKYNLTDPKDPAKENTMQGSKKQKGLIKDYEALDNLLIDEAIKGNIKSRDNLIALLKSQNIEVTRQGKDYISVKLPNSQKAKRFKGGIYDEKFTSIRDIATIYTDANERKRAYDKRENREVSAKLERTLDELIRKKAKFYRSRNEKADIQKLKSISNKKQNDNDNLYMRNVSNDDFQLNCMVSVGKTLSSIARTHNDNKQKILHSNTKERSNTSQQWRIDSNTNAIGGELDNIRSRIDSRNREIAKRTRASINTTREYTERKQPIITRARELDNQLSKLRDFVQEQFRYFRELANRVRKTQNLIKQRMQCITQQNKNQGNGR